MKKSSYEEASRASLNGVRISPQKARLIVDLVRGKQVDPALRTLKFTPKKGARILEKLILSAVQNYAQKNNADTDSLWVSEAFVDMGRTLRRFTPRARGSANMIKKQSSRITVILGVRS